MESEVESVIKTGNPSYYISTSTLGLNYDGESVNQLNSNKISSDPDSESVENVTNSVFQHSFSHSASNTNGSNYLPGFSCSPTELCVPKFVLSLGDQQNDANIGNGNSTRSKKPVFSGILMSLIALSFILACYLSFIWLHVESRYCRMSYMTPSYAKIKTFDLNYTRYASKYSLYLYREQNLDTAVEPNGIPVIFIPGNAGSYRQVRAIAAECANQYYNSPRHSSFNKTAASASTLQDDYVRSFDFFTADFSEDLTAFHGGSLLEQAEYLNDAINFILSLYQKSSTLNSSPELLHFPLPKSVILIGHSMGGMVARTMPTLPNYRQDSITTIITLSAPHSFPPASFDWDVVKIYEKVNKYWEDSFSQAQIGRNPLASVSLISITGGTLDHMIPSDYASVSSIVPPSNGFTAFTSTIPKVWSSIDHQAIVWCDQLRQIIAKALLDIVDIRMPSRTKSLNLRMGILRKYFLSGLESHSQLSIDQPSHYGRISSNNLRTKTLGAVEIDNSRIAADSANAPDTILLADYSLVSLVPHRKRLSLRALGSSDSPSIRLMSIPTEANSRRNNIFTLLTDRPLNGPSKFSMLTSDMKADIDDNDISPGVYILACKYPVADSEIYGSLLSVMDFNIKSFASSSPFSSGMLCRNLASTAIALPRAHMSAVSSVDPLSAPSEFDTMQFVQYNISQEYSFLAVVDTNELPTPGFVVCEISESKKSHVEVKTNWWQLLFGGIKIKLPVNRAIMTDISFRDIWSSLLTYKLKIDKQSCEGDICDVKTLGSSSPSNVPLFAPFVRQFTSDVYESKYFLNLCTETVLDLSLYGVAPFAPFHVIDDGQEGFKYHNLHLQMWSDSSCEKLKPLEISIQLDVAGSLGKLVLHYRIALVVFPVGIAALVLIIQLEKYGSSGVFISFLEGLQSFSSCHLVWLIAFSSILPFFLSSPFFRHILYHFEPDSDLRPSEGLSTIFIDVKRNQYFLGLEQSHLWFLGPLFLTVAAGLCYLIYALVNIVIGFISWLILLFVKFLTVFRIRVDTIDSPEIAAGSPDCSRSDLLSPSPVFTDGNSQIDLWSILDSAGTLLSMSRRRLILTAVLLGAVAVFVPYQFVFVIGFIAQIITTVKARYRLDAAKSAALIAERKNFYNYALTMLVFMIWIVPVNAPVLIVWIHNLALRWNTSFRTDHNFLAIGPMILLVEKMAANQMIPRMTRVSQQYFTKIMLIYISAYALIYGIRHAYWLHHLLNFFSAWLLVIYIEGDKTPRTKAMIELAGKDGSITRDFDSKSPRANMTSTSSLSY